MPKRLLTDDEKQRARAAAQKRSPGTVIRVADETDDDGNAIIREVKVGPITTGNNKR